MVAATLARSVPRHPRRLLRGGRFACRDAAAPRAIRTGHARPYARVWLPRRAHLLRIGLVLSQRRHECRCAARRDAGALPVRADGVHALRPDGCGCAARLVAAYEPE